VLESGRHYNSGYSEQYAFELVVPSEKQPDHSRGWVVEMLDKLNQGQAAIEWTIKVRLDAKGLDLVDSRKISIRDVC